MNPRSWSLVGISALLAGLGIASCGFEEMTKAASELSVSVDSLFHSIDLGTWAATYDNATTPELRQASTKEVWEKLGLTIRDRLGKLTSKSTKATQVNTMNGVVTAQATYEAQFEKGPGTITAAFRKSEGKWLLLNFHVNSPVFVEQSGTPCTKCGKTRPTEAAFCPACGAKVEAPAKKE